MGWVKQEVREFRHGHHALAGCKKGGMVKLSSVQLSSSSSQQKLNNRLMKVSHSLKKSFWFGCLYTTDREGTPLVYCSYSMSYFKPR